jgi:hypothetical protein
MKRLAYCFIIVSILIPLHFISAQDVNPSGQAVQDSLALLKMEIMRLKEQNKVFGLRLDSPYFGWKQQRHRRKW